MTCTMLRRSRSSGSAGARGFSELWRIAQQHLRSILAFCNSPQMNSIEAYIQFEPGLFGDDGQVTNESTRGFLQDYMAEFHNFIARAYTVLPRNA
jgi:chromate reductase, NAD(P)H dehydrogenase (quinone)